MCFQGGDFQHLVNMTSWVDNRAGWGEVASFNPLMSFAETTITSMNYVNNAGWLAGCVYGQLSWATTQNSLIPQHTSLSVSAQTTKLSLSHKCVLTHAGSVAQRRAVAAATMYTYNLSLETKWTCASVCYANKSSTEIQRWSRHKNSTMIIAIYAQGHKHVPIMSCASGDCLTSRPKGRLWPREL